MSLMARLRKGEGPFWGSLKWAIKKALHFHIPVFWLTWPLFAGLYSLHVGVREGFGWAVRFFWNEPLFRSQCAAVGDGFQMEHLPYIHGSGRITLGDNVTFGGQPVFIFGNRGEQAPELTIGDHTFVGHLVSFACSASITIGKDCLIAAGVQISDYDGHPVDAARRRAGDPTPPEGIRPVVIGDDVWIGASAIILKGVTIGGRSIIGAGAVVTRDVPPDTVVAGNPARVVKQLAAPTPPSPLSPSAGTGGRPSAHSPPPPLMKHRLNVVHVTLGLDLGGQEKLLAEFARHADTRRFALHFVSLTTRGPVADEIAAAGWPVTALGAPSGLRPGLVLRLAYLFRQLKADVVHTHDERPNIHAAPAAWLARARCVHTRHSQASKLTARQRLLVRLAAEANDAFVCISHDSARLARAQGIAARRLTVLHNGIDLTRFAHKGPDPAGPAVLVARLAPEKDIGTLLRAASLLTARHPDFRLLIAGDGPERPAMERLASELRLEDSVKFLGAVDDVPALLARARLFVLSSTTEGVSLTLLEAMARGLPIAATRVGGNPEVVADGETGLLVPPGDPEALAASVSRLWTSPETCARMGVAGRRRAEARFDVRRMVAGYERLYLCESPAALAREWIAI